MIRIISALILAVMATCTLAQESIKLVDNPPDRYIVVRGDTLWGISGKFLKEPWRWPEVWNLNKDQIKNPHWIYPGDVVILDTSSGQPRLRLGKSINGGTLKVEPRVYGDAVPEAIPSIPPYAIEPFISQPLVVNAKQLDTSPRIVATQEDRVFLGPGDIGFATGIVDDTIIDWQVYRPGKPLNDPESGETIGYEAYYLGSAKLTKTGAPATVKIATAKEELGRGDRLVPADLPRLASYVPHRPEQPVAGRVMSIYGGLNEGGKLSIVSLNRGTTNGLEPGHVLAFFRSSQSYGYDENGRPIMTPIPEERYALAFVFRTFERVSYALVMESSKPVMIGDAVRNP